mmetsp:Transcript_41428/g.50208  ORF Transcript_41428/g.50208 Transcript_41428/m.50208 type:complete len:137 (-) Transcript_41428:153-563(-)|eukprot:CAMPEP_0197861448 /NCGR_PEP_ID=MMETSP1438-20131217/37519_1 /TAXON_ID=1461541 /ORGANISM="Pterosperma sp., Strain CCMP1384" /LENGTH=136 /DNA_ID=CAMNT_0043478633 /DNA_START=188 /DNA_END=598 /DNA_ORIENTATION=-
MTKGTGHLLKLLKSTMAESKGEADSKRHLTISDLYDTSFDDIRSVLLTTPAALSKMTRIEMIRLSNAMFPPQKLLRLVGKLPSCDGTTKGDVSQAELFAGLHIYAFASAEGYIRMSHGLFSKDTSCDNPREKEVCT